jgi:molecular chaperone DnaK
LGESPHLFANAREHATLVATGIEALKSNDLDKLRNVVAQLDSIRFSSAGEDEMIAAANIVRG